MRVGKEGRRKEIEEERKEKREEYLPVKVIIIFTGKLNVSILFLPLPPSLFYLLLLLEHSPLFCDNDSGSTALIGVTIAWNNFNPCITVISMQVSHELCVE